MRFGPMSYNRWGYTYGDAVNNTDPRGRSISWGWRYPVKSNDSHWGDQGCIDLHGMPLEDEYLILLIKMLGSIRKGAGSNPTNKLGLE